MEVFCDLDEKSMTWNIFSRQTQPNVKPRQREKNEGKGNMSVAESER